MPLTNFSFGLTNVNLWSSENPYLYKLLLTVYDHDDNLVEVIPQKIGFREFKNGSRNNEVKWSKNCL